MKKRNFLQNASKPKGAGGKAMMKRMNRGHESLSAWGRSHLTIAPEDHVLDIGCGGGANVEIFCSTCTKGHVTGIDYSNVSVGMSRKKNKASILQKRCTIMQGNASSLHFQPATFNIVTAFETIYFWKDLEKCFTGIRTILKDGGCFMICNETDGHKDNDRECMEKIEGMRVYEEAQLKELLLKVGFKKVDTHVNDHHWLCIVAQN